jgi:hypothetical protein
VEDKPDTWKIATQPGGKQARWITGGDMEEICQTDDTKPLVLHGNGDGAHKVRLPAMPRKSSHPLDESLTSNMPEDFPTKLLGKADRKARLAANANHR